VEIELDGAGLAFTGFGEDLADAGGFADVFEGGAEFLGDFAVGGGDAAGAAAMLVTEEVIDAAFEFGDVAGVFVSVVVQVLADDGDVVAEGSGDGTVGPFAGVAQGAEFFAQDLVDLDGLADRSFVAVGGW
jgi:hypothetical protein